MTPKQERSCPEGIASGSDGVGGVAGRAPPEPATLALAALSACDWEPGLLQIFTDLIKFFESENVLIHQASAVSNHRELKRQEPDVEARRMRHSNSAPAPQKARQPNRRIRLAFSSTFDTGIQSISEADGFGNPAREEVEASDARFFNRSQRRVPVLRKKSRRVYSRASS